MPLCSGPGSFRVHGLVYHMIDRLQPPAEQGHPQFAQLYIHDTDHETDNRMSHDSGLERTTVVQLQDMLHRAQSIRAAL